MDSNKYDRMCVIEGMRESVRESATADRAMTADDMIRAMDRKVDVHKEMGGFYARGRAWLKRWSGPGASSIAGLPSIGAAPAEYGVRAGNYLTVVLGTEGHPWAALLLGRFGWAVRTNGEGGWAADTPMGFANLIAPVMDYRKASDLLLSYFGSEAPTWFDRVKGEDGIYSGQTLAGFLEEVKSLKSLSGRSGYIKKLMGDIDRDSIGILGNAIGRLCGIKAGAPGNPLGVDTISLFALEPVFGVDSLSRAFLSESGEWVSSLLEPLSGDARIVVPPSLTPEQIVRWLAGTGRYPEGSGCLDAGRYARLPGGRLPMAQTSASVHGEMVMPREDAGNPFGGDVLSSYSLPSGRRAFIPRGMGGWIYDDGVPVSSSRDWTIGRIYLLEVNGTKALYGLDGRGACRVSYSFRTGNLKHYPSGSPVKAALMAAGAAPAGEADRKTLTDALDREASTGFSIWLPDDVDPDDFVVWLAASPYAGPGASATASLDSSTYVHDASFGDGAGMPSRGVPPGDGMARIATACNAALAMGASDPHNPIKRDCLASWLLRDGNAVEGLRVYLPVGGRDWVMSNSAPAFIHPGDVDRVVRKGSALYGLDSSGRCILGYYGGGRLEYGSYGSGLGDAEPATDDEAAAVMDAVREREGFSIWIPSSVSPGDFVSWLSGKPERFPVGKRCLDAKGYVHDPAVGTWRFNRKRGLR